MQYFITETEYTIFSSLTKGKKRMKTFYTISACYAPFSEFEEETEAENTTKKKFWWLPCYIMLRLRSNKLNQAHLIMGQL